MVLGVEYFRLWSLREGMGARDFKHGVERS